MKKLFTVLTTAIVVLGLTSCNKKLKDDIKDLDKSLEDEKAQTATLQTQVGTLNNLLLVSPMTYSFTTTSDLGAAVSQGGTYSFGGGSNYTASYIVDEGGGDYYVYIQRASDIGGDFRSEIEFDYNSNTKVISNPQVNVYGTDINGNYNADFYTDAEATLTVAVSSFDYNAGTIAFTFGATTTSAYGDNIYSGKSMSFTSSYSGSMAKYID